jgi:site-specific recombinase XerD
MDRAGSHPHAHRRQWRGSRTVVVTGQVIGGLGVASVVIDVGAARAALDDHLDRLGLAMSPRTKVAYRRQAACYLDWLAEHAAEHPNAFADQQRASRAVTAWRSHQLTAGLGRSSISQGMAAVSLLYQVAVGLYVSKGHNTRSQVSGADDALTRAQEAAVRRAADERGSRDAAIVAVLLGTGARVAECARLRVQDVPTARAGTCRLRGTGGQERVSPLPGSARSRLAIWLRTRARLLADRPRLAAAADMADALWLGRQGMLSADAITGIVRTVGVAAGFDRPDLDHLRPHRLRTTYAARLREGGMNPAHIAALVDRALDS